jgi:hypothetical protein
MERKVQPTLAIPPPASDDVGPATEMEEKVVGPAEMMPAQPKETPAKPVTSPPADDLIVPEEGDGR